MDANLDEVPPRLADLPLEVRLAGEAQRSREIREGLARQYLAVTVYERAYVARTDTWIATLPVGHTDGWPRVSAKGARVRINGRLYPVIASISASHTIVELGPEQTVRAGDVATMFDWVDGSRPEDVAVASGASVYDLLMHLNPLLPRFVMTEEK